MGAGGGVQSRTATATEQSLQLGIAGQARQLSGNGTYGKTTSGVPAVTLEGWTGDYLKEGGKEEGQERNANSLWC